MLRKAKFFLTDWFNSQADGQCEFNGRFTLKTFPAPPESTEKPKPSKPSLLSSLFSDESAKVGLFGMCLLILIVFMLMLVCVCFVNCIFWPWL